MYRICSRCIMDTSAPDITFDEQGWCSYCRRYDERASNELHHNKAGQEKLKSLIHQVKKHGKNQEYDCLIGVSGGVDSSMVAYTVKRLGLRPLAIHLDNGWDSELAVHNVEKLVKKLNIDLYTHVLDWEEFKDLHLCFLKASVINSEAPTDHAIIAILYQLAAKKGIRYIFSGSNIVTEAIMPESWGYDNKDWRHINGIHKKFGTVNLRTFPRLTLFDWVYYTFVKRIMFIPILNYTNYNKKDAIKILQDELGWKAYGGKHWESVYTRVFQGYILPRKFSIDKRRAHLSTLICSGQMTREEALKEMRHEPYPPDILKEDLEYFLKKFGLTREEFEKIMSAPPKSYKEYPNHHFWFERLRPFVRLAKRMATNNG